MILESLRKELQTEAEWLGPINVREWFSNPQHNLEIDLGSGKGRFLLARATQNPDTNYLGIDRMMRRIRKVDNRARRMDLQNVRLLRMEAYYAVAHLLPPDAVNTIYIFFPDPWPKARHEGNRLFNPQFISALHRTLAPGGIVHIATDHTPYYDQLAEAFAHDSRFTPTPPFIPPEAQQTDFERYYLDSKPIHRLSLQKSESK